ncbi:MAG: tetratricopeptide repeat protein [Acidobacteria bacterium]|nr:tetratricopeptide repeat protein [Acidobacteriota bacterium]
MTARFKSRFRAGDVIYSLCLLAALELLAAPGWAQSSDPASAPSSAPTAATASSQAAPPNAEDLLRQAEAALQKEDYAAAAKILETYLEQVPEDYRAEFNLAYAYSLTGRPAEAIAHYKKVLSREPELIAAHRNLGILLVEQQTAAQAEEHLRFVVEKQPNDATAIFYWAEALSALQRTAEARGAYERVLGLDPDHVLAHLGAGKLLTETDPAAAENHLRIALQKDPSLEEAQLLLAGAVEARALNDPARLGEAAQLYEQYLAEHPGRSDVQLRLGQVYAASQKFEAAAEQFEALRKAGDSSPELREALLQAYLRGSAANPAANKEKAAALLEEILAQDESNAEMRLLYGRLQMEKKQYRQAAEQFLRVARLRPDSAEVFSNLASALYLVQDYAGTVAALDRVAALKQDTAGTYFLRAIALDKLGQLQPALDNYQRFLDTDEGKNPDQEFQSRQRIQVLLREIRRR